MKLILKKILNQLYKKYNGDIQILTEIINNMQYPTDNEKLEYIEYIKKIKERKNKK